MSLQENLGFLISTILHNQNQLESEKTGIDPRDYISTKDWTFYRGIASNCESKGNYLLLNMCPWWTIYKFSALETQYLCYIRNESMAERALRSLAADAFVIILALLFFIRNGYLFIIFCLVRFQLSDVFSALKMLLAFFFWVLEFIFPAWLGHFGC